MALRALIDGVEMDCLSVDDRGLQYGDGLFETIAVRDGRLCLWREHFERLSRGSARLEIPCPSQDLLIHECRRLIGSESTAVLKIVLTRGSGGRGYRPPEDVHTSRILTLHPWPQYPTAWATQGVAVTICRTPLGENPVLAGLKHLNRLEQVLARLEWQDPQIAEGLMQDGRGRVIGGTMSNLFLVLHGRLSTPRLDTCGIAGTARAVVLRIAAACGIEVAERDITFADLVQAHGLFLTNALIGAWSVRRLGTRDVSPGGLPAELIAAVMEAVLLPDAGERD